MSTVNKEVYQCDCCEEEFNDEDELLRCTFCKEDICADCQEEHTQENHFDDIFDRDMCYNEISGGKTVNGKKNSN